MKNKILSLLGIVLRSGNLVSGDDTTLSDLKKGKIKLIIIANDASENTKKLFKDKSEYRDVPYIIDFTKEELGKSIGKSGRAVIGIKNDQFATKINEISRG